jgi:hypothetical protein
MPVWHVQRNINLGGGGGTLQETYDISTPAEVVLNPANGAITIQDAAASIGDLLVLQSSGGVTDVFTVDGVGDTTATGTLLSSNIKRGTGDPSGVVAGLQGDVFQRTDGANANEVLYVSLGGMVWAALSAGAGGVTFFTDIIPIGGVILPGFPLPPLSIIPTQTASLQLDINGNTQVNTIDYTIAGAIVTWSGPFPIVPTDDVAAYYV